MEDSAIRYFFSDDKSDKRGLQFWRAFETGKLSEFVKVKNFVRDPLLAGKGIYDDDVHPEIVQFLVQLGERLKNIFGKMDSNTFATHNIASLKRSESLIGHQFVVDVVCKYNQLSSSDKDFYNNYVHVVNDAFPVSKELTLGEVAMLPESEQEHWRLNLRQSVLSTDEFRQPKICEELDKSGITCRYVSALDINNENGTPVGTAKFFGSPSESIGKVLSDAFYGQLLSAVASPSKVFHANLTEMIKSALSAVKNFDETSLPDSSILDITTGDVIDIKNGVFVKKEGVHIAPFELTDGNCYTTQFNGTQQECHKFIYELLLNEDADAFNNYFKNLNDSSFALKAKTDIAKVHPDMAVKILKKFGFEVLSVPTAGKSLQKFESVYSWAQKLNQTLNGSDTLKNIQKAHHLKTYLDLLVHYVNNNPVILNSGVSAMDHTIESDAVDPQSYLGRTHVAMIPRIPLGEPIADKHDVLLQMASTANMAHRLLSLPASMPFPFKVARLPGMVGGSMNSSSTLRPIIRGLISDLARKGKKLRASDQDAIEGHLMTLDKLERALGKVSQQLNEFKDWVSIFPDNKQEVVSLGTIEGSIDKYRACVAQHANLELGLINVAIKLCEQK